MSISINLNKGSSIKDLPDRGHIKDFAIETQNLGRRFGDIQAVANLNLRVPNHSIFGLIGPNGAGKTTTIKMLLGLLRPTTGRASVLGRDIVTDSLWIRSKVGYVMETQAMYGYLMVAETIGFCRRLYPRWNDALVGGYCKSFGLPMERKVSKLSKGMKTQLALILALGPDPDLLILDEPTSGLDPVRRHEFLTIVIGEMADTGKTVFLSSHVLPEVERVCDHIGIIDRGALILSGPLDRIKEQEKKVRIIPQGPLPEEIARMRQVRRVDREGAGYLISTSARAILLAGAVIFPDITLWVSSRAWGRTIDLGIIFAGSVPLYLGFVLALAAATVLSILTGDSWKAAGSLLGISLVLFIPGWIPGYQKFSIFSYINATPAWMKGVFPWGATLGLFVGALVLCTITLRLFEA